MKAKTVVARLTWLAAISLMLPASAWSAGETPTSSQRQGQEESRAGTSMSNPSAGQQSDSAFGAAGSTRSGAAANAARFQSAQRASELIGMPVRNGAGEQLGTVKDIVLSEDRESVEYIAFSTGGPLARDKFVRAEINRISPAAEGSYLTYEISPAQAEAEASDLDEALPWSRRVSQLLGLEVRDAADQQVGKLRDLLVDLRSHQIVNATVGIGGFIGIGEKLASVDWQSLSIEVTERYASVNMPGDQLRNVAFDASEYWEQLGFAGDEGARSGEYGSMTNQSGRSANPSAGSSMKNQPATATSPDRSND
jgi:sporulation protein YlmC with PRC-barrel domain